MSELLFEQAGRFKGAYPDIPLPDDIDREALGKVDFVTLPIGKVNAKSVSGRVYTRKAVEQLVEQVNGRRPEGRWGHLKDEERSTKYEPPAIRWLAAILTDDGTAWAKGVPTTEQAREHFRVARATNALVGTSIYGTGDYEGVKVVGVDIETIDLADPSRVGVPETAAKPQLTKEMEGNPMGEAIDPLVAELRSDRDTARKVLSEMETQLSELKPLAEQVKAVKAVLAEYADSFASASISVNANGTDIVQVIRELADKLVAMGAEQLQARINAVVGEMVKVPADTPQGKALLKYVNLALGKVKDEAEAKAKLAEIMADETYQTLAKGVVREIAGPNVVVAGAGKQQTTDWRQNIADNADKIAAEVGVKK